MRPSAVATLLLLGLVLVDGCVGWLAVQRWDGQQRNKPMLVAIVSSLGLSDLAVATEARFTRHPAVSDPLAPFMDHPGALDHFPTTVFWAMPRTNR